MISNKVFHLVALAVVMMFNCCQRSPTNTEISYEEEILFVSGRHTPEILYGISPDGTGLRTIIEGGYRWTDATFSPSKGYIAAVGFSGFTVPPVIVILDHEGNIVRQLTSNGVAPVWSPNESKILFARLPYFSSVISNIFIINIDGTNENQLTNSTWKLLTPLDWSHEGDIILGHEVIFFEDSTGRRGSNRGEITLLTPDWELLKYITDNDVADPSASFSSNPDSVAFVSGKYRKRDVYIMDLETGQVTNVTNKPGEYRKVVWSPNEKEIALTVNVFNSDDHKVGSDILIIDLRKSTVRNLTNTGLDSIYNRLVDWK